MAKRRMISLDVIGTDKFLALSIAAKGVYMCLTGKADDDGFVASALTTTLISRGTEADLNELVDTGYLIRFDSGIYLIRHWPLSNHVQNDRYTATLYKKEMASVVIYDHVYYLPDDPEYISLKSIPDTKPKRSVSKMDTQVSKGKDSKDKPSKGEETATLPLPRRRNYTNMPFRSDMTALILILSWHIITPMTGRHPTAISSLIGESW